MSLHQAQALDHGDGEWGWMCLACDAHGSGFWDRDAARAAALVHEDTA